MPLTAPTGQRTYRLMWGYLILSFGLGGYGAYAGTDLMSIGTFCVMVGAGVLAGKWGNALEAKHANGTTTTYKVQGDAT